MAKCPSKLQLNAYVDGELSLPETRQICSHLTKCTCCANTVKELHHTIDQVQQLPWEKPSAPITILASQPVRFRLLRPVLAASLLLTAVGTGLFIGHNYMTRQANREVEYYLTEHQIGAHLHVDSYGLFGN